MASLTMNTTINPSSPPSLSLPPSANNTKSDDTIWTNVNGRNNRQSGGGSVIKTRLCNSVAKHEKCPYGGRCRYAHTRKEIVRLPCSYGDECIFVCTGHLTGDLVNDSTKQKICRYQHPSESVDSYHDRVGTPVDPLPSDMATWPTPAVRTPTRETSHNLSPSVLKRNANSIQPYIETSARRGVSNKPAWMEDDMNSFSRMGIDAMDVFKAVEDALDKGCTTIVIKGIDYNGKAKAKLFGDNEVVDDLESSLSDMDIDDKNKAGAWDDETREDRMMDQRYN